jgi:hypothetical protein
MNRRPSQPTGSSRSRGLRTADPLRPRTTRLRRPNRPCPENRRRRRLPRSRRAHPCRYRHPRAPRPTPGVNRRERRRRRCRPPRPVRRRLRKPLRRPRRPREHKHLPAGSPSPRRPLRQPSRRSQRPVTRPPAPRARADGRRKVGPGPTTPRARFGRELSRLTRVARRVSTTLRLPPCRRWPRRVLPPLEPELPTRRRATSTPATVDLPDGHSSCPRAWLPSGRCCYVDALAPAPGSIRIHRLLSRRPRLPRADGSLHRSTGGRPGSDRWTTSPGRHEDVLVGETATAKGGGDLVGSARPGARSRGPAARRPSVSCRAGAVEIPCAGRRARRPRSRSSSAACLSWLR